MNVSLDTIDKFHSTYQGNPDKLKRIPPLLIALGLDHMDILSLTMQETKLGLGEAISLLEIPDVLL